MKGSSWAGACNMPGRLGSPSSSELSDQRTKTSSILDNSQSLTSTISEEYSAIVKACRSNSVDALLTLVPSALSSMDSQGEVGDSNGTGMRASNLPDSGGLRESSEASSCTKKKAVDDETLVQCSASLNLVNVEDGSQLFAGASAPETSTQHSWPIPKRMGLRTSPCNVVAESSENASQLSTTAGAAQHPVTRRSNSLTVESRTRSSGNVCRAANPEDLSPDKISEAGRLRKPDEALAAVEPLTAKIEQEITPTKESELPAVSADSNPQGPKRRKTQQKRTILVSVVGNGGKSSSEDVSADLWAWRKYGQKPIKGSPYPRGYYRCSSSKGCLARKQVERSRNDPSKLIVSYTAEHNHPWPSHRNSLAGSTRVTSPHKEPSGSARTCSMASLEKQGSSDTAAELKAESEEPARPCDAHSMHEMVVQEEEEFANGADDESKAEIVSVTNEKLLSGAITFGTSDTHHSTGSPGALHEPLNVDSSGQMQIVVQSYTESHEHLMLESLSRSSMEDEDFFAELEELPDSSMAVFGWGSFLEDQSDDEGVGTTVVDPYNLFCWSTTSSVKSKAVI